MYETEIKRGDVLPNGATVVDFKTARERSGCVPGKIVICLIVGKGFEPFAVWEMRDDNRACFSGGYHERLQDAVSDFEWRS